MKKTLAVIGGTGDLGSGLAKRWAEAGYTVMLGSRDATKAATAAETMSAELIGRKLVKFAVWTILQRLKRVRSWC